MGRLPTAPVVRYRDLPVGKILTSGPARIAIATGKQHDGRSRQMQFARDQRAARSADFSRHPGLGTSVRRETTLGRRRIELPP